MTIVEGVVAEMEAKGVKENLLANSWVRME